MEYMATLPDKAFELAIVDPPYGLGSSVVNSQGRFKRYENKNGNWDNAIPKQEYFNELFRVSKDYVVISVPNEPVWRISNMLRGSYIKNLGNTPGHINHYNSRSLKKLINPYSSDIKIYKPFPWLIAIAKKR